MQLVIVSEDGTKWANTAGTSETRVVETAWLVTFADKKKPENMMKLEEMRCELEYI